MKSITIRRHREFLIMAIIISFVILAIAVFPKKIDEGVIWFISIGNFKASFGLNQTIDYLIEIPPGWLSLKMQFVLSGIFITMALVFSFILGKVFFEGSNPIRVTNIAYANKLVPSRYYSYKGKCRFSVIVGDGNILDVYGRPGDLIADVGVNEHHHKLFNKIPGRKGELLKYGEALRSKGSWCYRW